MFACEIAPFSFRLFSFWRRKKKIDRGKKNKDFQFLPLNQLGVEPLAPLCYFGYFISGVIWRS
ncbi:hypothetical protein A2276_07115 [candidate division WOR-1 bacterium RIFOXYA12_FULL_43_27]|uniref:Uncharacterized protein n=1 Tax=candidate division WOR-1 bacterium RIFOXYC2_FULL_46_14 TaxID=1802587 RepID=A0A1F4U325_UNCSA|nr:MAG: hypothetical protein A2276_07115 [candidate division WOR-1 bacterium RIFOXYA12_FULL_43_27]OGC18855.1 MAG: hypothetical protein A2292_07970 [candidate division WOR-1 bacterium RIFOXYB2_FULL_46_45]OGC28996.1 MAG: hypothetical protein A2232_03035 [candidate division WOR-1 bacterium RIFOXYA2_FULL_46_56]OGC39378.1 MAG: hypothetical protein A2438_06650 [candidate division WOR-1 bacterium RIFOXYC2_FULL_46_14]